MPLLFCWRCRCWRVRWYALREHREGLGELVQWNAQNKGRSVWFCITWGTKPQQKRSKLWRPRSSQFSPTPKSRRSLETLQTQERPPRWDLETIHQKNTHHWLITQIIAEGVAIFGRIGQYVFLLQFTHLLNECHARRACQQCRNMSLCGVSDDAPCDLGANQAS